MKTFLSLILAIILVVSMILGMVSCDTTDDQSDSTQQTEANELEEAKVAAKATLESYVNSENYREAEKTLLETTITDGKTAIDAATAVADVTAALNSAKVLVDAIKTDAVLTAEELLAAKNTAKTVLEGYVNAENYRDAQKAELATAIANGKTAIDNATDITAVSTALTTAKATIDEIKTDAEFVAEELLSAKNTAKAELDVYVNATDYRTEQQTALATAIADGKTAIDASADIAAVNTALANAKASIDQIKTNAELTAEELATAKINAKEELDSYVRASDYRAEQQTSIATAISNGKIAIDAAPDITAVNTALANAKAVIDEIKTDAELTAEELAAAKSEAKAALDAYVNVNDYRAEQQSAITSAIAGGKNAIDAATTKAGVTSALDSSKLLIDAIKTDREMTAEELASAKQTAKNALASYAKAADYREAQKTELSLAITNGNNAIDAASDITAVNTALANAKAVIDKIKTDAELTAEELVAAKAAAKTTLESYKNASDYREAQKTELQSAITNGKNAIDNASDKAGVEAALANAKSAIDAIETDAEITAKEPTIETDINTEKVYSNTTSIFNVTAKDAAGNKLNKENVVVTVNGVAATVNWDDAVKTSYNLVLVEGQNTIVIVATSGAYSKTVSYTVSCNPEVATSIVVAIEAFSVGLEYVVEPYKLTFDSTTLTDMAAFFGFDSAEEMKENMNAAYALEYVIYINDLTSNYTGDIGSTYYLSSVTGLDTSGAYITDELMEAIENLGMWFMDYSVTNEGTLSEMDFTQYSGWMYGANGVALNVGFGSYVPQNGDVIRVQFTLAWGMDVGLQDGLGMGDIGSIYPEVNKDELTALIAEALSQGVDATEEMEIAYLLDTDQETIDEACASLREKLQV